MKTQTIFLIMVGILFITTFFFNTIPIPVSKMGTQHLDNFVYGGMYWTSGLYELGVKNYVSILSYLSIFLISIGGGYLINKI